MRKFILAAILVAMAFAIVLVSGTVSPVVGQVIAPFSPSFPCARPTIAGTAGNDIRLGTHGPDVIDGREGKNIIAGLGGDDIICGGDDNDLLIGGNGNDTLDGGTGIDILHGNAGDDTIVIRAGDVPDGAEVINGGSDVVTLILGGGLSLAHVAGSPPNFIVKDPLTGGVYIVINVEKILVEPALTVLLPFLQNATLVRVDTGELLEAIRAGEEVELPCAAPGGQLAMIQTRLTERDLRAPGSNLPFLNTYEIPMEEVEERGIAGVFSITEEDFRSWVTDPDLGMCFAEPIGPLLRLNDAPESQVAAILAVANAVVYNVTDAFPGPIDRSTVLRPPRPPIIERGPIPG